MHTAFSQLGISQALVEALHQNGVTRPTPVQEKTIPLMMTGSDIIAQAQTGTGKTLAFVLPILERIKPDLLQTQALIISPTRELAIQIAKETTKYAAVRGVKVLAAYGGQDVEAQLRKMKTPPPIVVGTPGRLLDHHRRGTLQLHRLQTLVLDEADVMLDMGFLNEVDEILRHVPSKRQTVLVSATIPGGVRQMADRYMDKPEDVRIKGNSITLDNIRQIAAETTDRGKSELLRSLIGVHHPYLGVVFCRTKIRAKKLNETLQANGIESDELHGDLSQAKREQVMKRFREAKLQILVATDVAARGIDVEGVTHVFNYDIPQDTDSYIHRIGRTGRAGQDGVAITLYTARDKAALQQIERGIDTTMERLSKDTFTTRRAATADQSPSSRRPSTRDHAEAAPRRGADRGSSRGGERGFGRGSERGSSRGAERGSSRGGERGAHRGFARGADRDRGTERGADRGSSRGGERGADRGTTRGGERGAARGADHGWRGKSDAAAGTGRGNGENGRAEKRGQERSFAAKDRSSSASRDRRGPGAKPQRGGNAPGRSGGKDTRKRGR